jgi:hypothetical protein
VLLVCWYTNNSTGSETSNNNVLRKIAEDAFYFSTHYTAVTFQELSWTLLCFFLEMRRVKIRQKKIKTMVIGMCTKDL